MIFLQGVNFWCIWAILKQFLEWPFLILAQNLDLKILDPAKRLRFERNGISCTHCIPQYTISIWESRHIKKGQNNFFCWFFWGIIRLCRLYTFGDTTHNVKVMFPFVVSFCKIGHIIFLLPQLFSILESKFLRIGYNSLLRRLNLGNRCLCSSNIDGYVAKCLLTKWLDWWTDRLFSGNIAKFIVIY